MGAHVPSSPAPHGRARAGFPRRAGCGAAGDRVWVIRDFIPAIAWACVIAIAMADAEALRIAPAVPQPPDAHRARHHGGDLVAGRAAGGRRGDPGDRGHDLREWLRTIQDNGIPVPDVVARLPYGAAQITEWWQANLAHPRCRPPRCTASTARNSSRSAGSSAPLAHAARIRLHARHAVRDPARRPQAVGALLQGARRAFGAAARS